MANQLVNDCRDVNIEGCFIAIRDSCDVGKFRGGVMTVRGGTWARGSIPQNTLWLTKVRWSCDQIESSERDARTDDVGGFGHDQGPPSFVRDALLDVSTSNLGL